LERRSWPDAASFLLRRVTRALGTPMGLVLEHTPAAERLRVVAATGWEGSAPGATLALVPGSAIDRALRAPGEVVVEPHREPGPAEEAFLPQFAEVGSNAMIAFDAGSGRQGILGLFENEPRAFARDEYELLAAIAEVAGGAARRA